MIECKKRQKVVSNKTLTYRCINRESDIYGQNVGDICDDCPLNKLNENGWGGSCSRRKAISNSVAFCLGINKEVTKQECVICLMELATHGLNPDTIIKEYNDNEAIIKENSEKDFPSLLTQANNYRLAVTRWIKAGRPTRTDEEIDNIFVNICKKCNWYDVETSRCRGCGCRVVPKGLALVNKLKMATEHCPQDKF